MTISENAIEDFERTATTFPHGNADLQEGDTLSSGLKPPRFSSLNEARKGSTRPLCRVFSGHL